MVGATGFEDMYSFVLQLFLLMIVGLNFIKELRNIDKLHLKPSTLFIGSFVLYEKITGKIDVQGWASIVIVISFFSGCILISLGMIAEYLAVSIGASMGKPLYVISSRSSRSQK
jgi:hypothetical protein